jgi:murein DD-endopeptidase MepM/ murein hydrolase activator NlpD
VSTSEASRPGSGREDDEGDVDDGDDVDAVETRRSFLSNVAATVKSLVVRKSDSKPVSLPEEELSELFRTDFPLPLELFPKEKFRDSFDSRRGRHRRHHAIDLPAPRGTPVVAVADGVIERVGRDRRGGKVVYLRDTPGRFTFYYAHLKAYVKGLKAGDRVKRGQRLGEVGATGHIIGGPHLHFAIFRHEEASGTRALVVNPYLIFGAIVLK